MQRISSSVLDEIRQLNIADVISQHVNLVRKGHTVMGLCPFHAEKTPSFHVHENKGFYKCFGCNEAGDAITFIMKYMNFDYVTAITYICENFGIDLRYDSERSTPQKPLKDMKALHEMAAKYAQKIMFSKTGERALQYLLDRSFDKETIERFELGYFPADASVAPFLKEFSENVITESGIFYKTYKGWQCFFGDRILFPIRSATGQCVGFSGRTINPEEKVKYKNSQETPIFSKRKELYNLHRAREAMRSDKCCYIVEGYFDAIRMVVAGYPQTVAIMGTAFTKEQIGQLKKYAEEYNLILDGDEAGQKAMQDSRNAAVDCNIYPNVIILPRGTDPDTYIKDNGKEAFSEIISTKEDLFLRTIRIERGKATDNNRKFHRLKDIKLMLKQIKDPYRKEYYINEAANIFGVAVETLSKDIAPQVATPVKFTGKHNLVNHICEKDFMSTLMSLSTESAVRLLNDMNDSHFEDEKIREIFKKTVELFAQSGSMSALINDPVVGGTATDLLSRECSNTDLYAEAVKNKDQILLKYYQKERQVLAFKQAQTMDDDEKISLSVRSMELVNTIRKLQTQLASYD